MPSASWAASATLLESAIGFARAALVSCCDGEMLKRDERWSEAIAVGNQAYIEELKRQLGIGAVHREVDEANGPYALREPMCAHTYGFDTGNSALTPDNTILLAEKDCKSSCLAWSDPIPGPLSDPGKREVDDVVSHRSGASARHHGSSLIPVCLKNACQ